MLVDWVQGIGFIGLLVLLALPKTREWLGFNGSKNEIHDVLSELKKELSYEAPDRPALVARIPFICKDIREIRNALSQLEQDVSFIRGKIDQ